MPSSRHERRRSVGYPTGRLMAVIDDPAAAAGAMAELVAAGIAPDDLELLRGAEGADRVDGTGGGGGPAGRLRRAIDFTLMDQLVDFVAYERALRDGRAVVLVRARDDPRKAAAVAVLRGRGGHFVNYFGRFATEEIDPWRGPEPEIADFLRR
ncbi:MAG TPA: hypothetical protein VIU37_09345 [Candidatus Limnocylindrales bacterium]|jgi:hypothetical protein